MFRSSPAGWLCALLILPLSSLAAEEKREPIGTVGGKPVYRDQIRTKGFSQKGELMRLFALPALEKFKRDNKAKITPTKEEIAAAVVALEKQQAKRLKGEYGNSIRKLLEDIEQKLKNDDLPALERTKLIAQKRGFTQMLKPTRRQNEMTAAFLLNNWKFQRFLYDNFGGGRIVWQQAGVEAFDAMHKWLQSREKAGDFTITDAKLRAEFYEYWTNEKMHGAFLTGDPQRIKDTFLQPEWLGQKKP